MLLAPTASLHGGRESQEKAAPRLPWAQHTPGMLCDTAHDQTLEQERRERSPSVQGKIFLPSHFPG